MSGRDCSFASEAPVDHPSVSGSSSQDERLIVSPDSNRSSTSGVTPVPGTTPPVQDPIVDAEVNLDHMELLIHLSTDRSMFSLGDNVGDFFSTYSFTLKAGLESPYLLHQLLAFSARHLAYLHPGRSAHYLHLAVTLQTRAISLYNASRPEVDQSNCVAVLLFSVALGHHLLADTLANREPGGLDAFMKHYVQCVEMNRGIHTVARTAWPLLLESELEPVLSWSAGNTSRPSEGDHCKPLRELVDNTEGLQEEEKEACRQAIEYLQLGFDALFAEGEADGNPYQMIFSWTMLAPPEFTSLLAAKRPEVLILLSYYALLLYYGRNIWQVGDTGMYIMGLIEDYLSPEWHHWLRYPREIMSSDLG
ncbi:C6 finger domain [Fusarium albosuccineum]|uniref:C6 finger domain n=1 Tax=Fusarium albosuccineum TaxID=1237068 RepID=A0A8H4LJN2_9HYPO|nr:C6 finger domain [Fusarium albosuccineum]